MKLHTPPRFYQSLIFRLLASLLCILLVIFSTGHVINTHIAKENLYQQRDAQIAAQRDKLNQDLMEAEIRLEKDLKAQLKIVATSAKGPLLNALSTVTESSTDAEKRIIEQFAQCFQNGATQTTYECLKIRSNYFSIHSTRLVNRLMIKTTIQLLLSHEDMIAVEILDWENKLFDGFVIDQKGNIISIDKEFSPPEEIKKISHNIIHDEYLGQVVFYYTTSSITEIKNKAEMAISEFIEYTEQQVNDSSQQITSSRLIEGSIFFIVSLLAISGIVVFTVLSPLLSLTRQAKALSKGKFSDQNNSVYRNDELGHLAQTFQVMSNNLRQYYEELQQANSQLEHKVLERTLELEQKNRELRQLSVTDKLTQIYNRVKLEEELDQQIATAKCYKHHFSILICDIDFFKQVNDTYGHQIGDKVLVDTARIMQHTIREIDIVGRWGGEEFLIICPETNNSDAMIIAERLRNAVEKHIYPDLEKGSTLSIGVNSYLAEDSKENLLEYADQALYAAKSAGRNRVFSATDLCPPPNT